MSSLDEMYMENKTLIISCKTITQQICFLLLNKVADNFRNIKLKSFSGIISWHLHVKSDCDSLLKFGSIEMFELKILNNL